MATKQEMIDYVLDNFDFERVHKAMVALDWHWASVGDVPEIYDLRVKSRELLHDVLRKEQYLVGTGGLYATYDREYDMLGLRFCIDDFSCDNELKCY